MEICIRDVILVLGITVTTPIVTYAIYNLYLHPLAKYNGPKLWACFRTPFVISMVTGKLPHDLNKFHAKYGEVLRVAPDELSFVTPLAWRDIHVPRAGQAAWPRPRIIKPAAPKGGPYTLISADELTHSRLRKALSPAFAEKALREQHEIVERYAALMVHKLRSLVMDNDPSGATICDLTEWYNYVAFDIVGDLSFGESFECLENAAYHPWIKIMATFKGTLLALGLNYYPILPALRQRILSKTTKSAMRDLNKLSTDKTERRLAKGTDRADFISHILKERSDHSAQISEAEVGANARLFILGGSETLTTALVGTTNCLLGNPQAYTRLTQELRSTFSSAADITTVSVQRLPYLNAVLKEGLRVCPPIPDGLRRQVPPEGAAIGGHWVPGNTTVSIAQWPASQSAQNFTKSTDFLPERWLNLSGFENDRQAALQPFGLGPRSCLGQSLAWIELRVILAQTLWNFDISAPNGANVEGKGVIDWPKQKIYWNWEKEPLKTELKLAPQVV